MTTVAQLHSCAARKPEFCGDHHDRRQVGPKEYLKLAVYSPPVAFASNSVLCLGEASHVKLAPPPAFLDRRLFRLSAVPSVEELGRAGFQRLAFDSWLRCQLPLRDELWPVVMELGTRGRYTERGSPEQLTRTSGDWQSEHCTDTSTDMASPTGHV